MLKIGIASFAGGVKWAGVDCDAVAAGDRHDTSFDAVGAGMETALVMRIGPKPALSMAVTSPPASTTLTACWKFLYGEPKVHALLSLP
jgi:hypothetical protein